MLTVYNSWNVKLATASRSYMPVSVDAGDRSAELGQVTSSHKVLTFQHLDAQFDSDPVGNVEPMYTVSQIKRGHFSFRHNFYSC